METPKASDFIWVGPFEDNYRFWGEAAQVKLTREQAQALIDDWDRVGEYKSRIAKLEGAIKEILDVKND